MARQAAKQAGGARAWLIWSLSALAFGYAFFQRVAPSVMVSDLMREFAVGAAVLGYLSALYFYPYVLLQIPLGALLDRLGARVLLTLAVSVAAVGTFLFGTAQTLEQAYAGRFLIGAGSACGFIGSLALAAKWFPPRRFAFLTGFSMFFAMICGIAGQAPLALLIAAVGWREAMLYGAVFAGVLAVLILALVRNAPAAEGAATVRRTPQSWRSIGRGLGQALARSEVWLISTVSMCMTGVMLAFGGLWGVPFLMEAYGLERPDAAFYVSLMLLGWAAGAPLSGWLSDHLGRRRLPLIMAAGLETVFVGVIVLVPGLPLWLIVVLFVLTGAMGGAMSITFALARELTSPSIHGTVTGVVNAMTVASGAILQPIIGALLDLQWDGALRDGARVYEVGDYRTAFLSLLAWSAAGFAASLALRETYCRQKVVDEPAPTPA